MQGRLLIFRRQWLQKYATRADCWRVVPATCTGTGIACLLWLQVQQQWWTHCQHSCSQHAGLWWLVLQAAAAQEPTHIADLQSCKTLQTQHPMPFCVVGCRHQCMQLVWVHKGRSFKHSPMRRFRSASCQQHVRQDLHMCLWLHLLRGIWVSR